MVLMAIHDNRDTLQNPERGVVLRESNGMDDNNDRKRSRDYLGLTDRRTLQIYIHNIVLDRGGVNNGRNNDRFVSIDIDQII